MPVNIKRMSEMTGVEEEIINDFLLFFEMEQPSITFERLHNIASLHFGWMREQAIGRLKEVASSLLESDSLTRRDIIAITESDFIDDDIKNLAKEKFSVLEDRYHAELGNPSVSYDRALSILYDSEDELESHAVLVLSRKMEDELEDSSLDQEGAAKILGRYRILSRYRETRIAFRDAVVKVAQFFEEVEE